MKIPDSFKSPMMAHSAEIISDKKILFCTSEKVDKTYALISSSIYSTGPDEVKNRVGRLRKILLAREKLDAIPFISQEMLPKRQRILTSRLFSMDDIHFISINDGIIKISMKSGVEAFILKKELLVSSVILQKTGLHHIISVASTIDSRYSLEGLFRIIRMTLLDIERTTSRVFSPFRHELTQLEQAPFI